MADFKVIMTLAIAGGSYDEIVAAAGCSRRDVATAKKTIAAYSRQWQRTRPNRDL